MGRQGLASAVIVIVLLLAGCGNNRTFDAAAWQTANARDRGRMSQSLVNSRVLVGKSAAETQRLLGQADSDFGSALAYKIHLGFPLKDPKH